MSAKENPTPPINVLLLLTDHLPRRWREVHDEIRRAEQRTQDLRKELSRLEKHAAIEGIPLGDHAAEPLALMAGEPEATRET